MKKHTLLTLSLAALALGLASCGSITPPSSSSPSSESASATESASGHEGDSDTQGSDSYDASTEDLSSTEGQSADSEPLPTAWTDEQIALMKEYLNGTVLPFLPLGSLDFSVDDTGTITITGVNEDLDPLDVEDALTALGFVVQDNSVQGSEPTMISARLIGEDYSYVFLSIAFGEGAYSATAAYFPTQQAWPEQDILDAAEYTGISEVPSFDADAYCFYVTSDMFGLTLYSVIECYGESVGEGSVDDYTEYLKSLQWEIDDTYYAEYGEMMATYEGYNLDYYFDGYGLVIYANGAIDESVDAFPMEDLQAWVEAVGSTAEKLPTYEAEKYNVDFDDDPDGFFGQYFDVWSPVETLDESDALLTTFVSDAGELGWSPIQEGDGEVTLIDETKTLSVYACSSEDEDGPYFFIEFAPYEYIEPHDESFEEAVAGETSVLSFADETDLISVEDTEGLWNNHAFSMKVNKGSSDLAVGGAGSAYLCNPLRTYAGQQITIYAELPIASIEFEWTGKNESSKVQPSAPSVGEFNDNVLTLPADTKEVTFSVSSGQIRFFTVSVTFAA